MSWINEPYNFFLQCATVILWQIIKAAGKHFWLLSHDDASMAVYGEQEIHATNDVQRRTTRIPIRYMAQFAKYCIASAVNWQFFCLWLPFGDADENIDKRTKEEGSLCNNDAHLMRIRCSSSEFKACSSCFPRNHNAVITIFNTNLAAIYSCLLSFLFTTPSHVGIVSWVDNIESTPTSRSFP